MASECVKVIVRCRPMNEREYSLKCACCLQMDAARAQCVITNPHDVKAPPKHFTFDGAYFTESTTENIYNEIAYPLVEVGKFNPKTNGIFHKATYNDSSMVHCIY